MAAKFALGEIVDLCSAVLCTGWIQTYGVVAGELQKAPGVRDQVFEEIRMPLRTPAVLDVQADSDLS